MFICSLCSQVFTQPGDVHIRAMGAQQAKERERTASAAGSLHSLTLPSSVSRPVKPKLSSTRSRDTSTSSRSHAFNVFAEHNGRLLLSAVRFCFVILLPLIRLGVKVDCG